jgi:hypothetical protein
MIWTITCSPSSTGTPTSHHMLLVYEAIKVRMNILLLSVITIFTCYQWSIFICWSILLLLYMLMLGLSRVNLVWFWVTVSFGLLSCRWWTFGRLPCSTRASRSWRWSGVWGSRLLWIWPLKGRSWAGGGQEGWAMAAWPGHAISVLFSSTVG